MPIAHLPRRAVLEVTGPDRLTYLQGLVSNDVTKVAPGQAIWAALLTPQGKYLADFFILSDQDRLLLDTQADQAEDLARRLSRFRLRSQVTIQKLDWTVWAGWGGAQPPAGGISAPDPRLSEAGWRALSAAPLQADTDDTAWDRHRLRLGLPDGTRDMEIEKTVLLEAGFDELNGIAWDKGCYMGQELTARTKYRGLLKRRLFPVSVQGALPAPGSPIIQDGQEVGTMRSGCDNQGLALLRLASIGRRDALTCGDATVQPHVPAWMHLPDSV